MHKNAFLLFHGNHTLLRLLLLSAFLLICTPGRAWPWQWNKVNRQGERTGKWHEFYEHKPNQLMYKGRFKKGKERGTWKTFSPEGKLERKERYNPTKKSIYTTFFHPNGKISHQGTAYLFEEDGFLMYKWHGDWQYYDTAGKWRGYKSFNRGRASTAEPIGVKASDPV